MIAKIFIFESIMDEISNIISGSIDTSTSINNLLSGSMDPNSALQNIQSSSGGFLSGFSFQTIMAGIFMGIIGMYLIKTGKKEGKTLSLLCGLALCIVPYFIQKTSYLIGAGIVLIAIPIITKN